MRIEHAEFEHLESARRYIDAQFAPFLRLNDEERTHYWPAVEVPYIPFYAYSEMLCAFGDPPGRHPGSMSASIERIVSYLTDGRIAASSDIDEPVRAKVVAQFSRFAPEPLPDLQKIKCFISYSGEDSLFAGKLCHDLRSSGVNCWFAPDDLPMGAKTRTEIDRAIRDCDRVILVLSSSSISSPWVEKEVETAFEREKAMRRTVVVPLRLDGAILEAKEGWAADIRRQRCIGDFTAWQDDRAYRIALSRLLSSLAA
jgi:hypothetical protein